MLSLLLPILHIQGSTGFRMTITLCVSTDSFLFVSSLRLVSRYSLLFPLSFPSFHTTKIAHTEVTFVPQAPTSEILVVGTNCTDLCYSYSRSSMPTITPCATSILESDVFKLIWYSNSTSFLWHVDNLTDWSDWHTGSVKSLSIAIGSKCRDGWGRLHGRWNREDDEVALRLFSPPKSNHMHAVALVSPGCLDCGTTGTLMPLSTENLYSLSANWYAPIKTTEQGYGVNSRPTHHDPQVSNPLISKASSKLDT